MLEAGKALVDYLDGETVQPVIAILNKHLDTSVSSSGQHDAIRESVVILLGAAAKHLQKSDSSIADIKNKLLLTSSTPSESVQLAVSEAL